MVNAESQSETEHGVTGDSEVSISTYQVSAPPVTEEEACPVIDKICTELKKLVNPLMARGRGWMPPLNRFFQFFS